MPKDRTKYYKERSKKVINFVIDDDDLKRRLKEAAEADGRTINGWIRHHVVPTMAQQIDAQLKKTPAKK